MDWAFTANSLKKQLFAFYQIVQAIVKVILLMNRNLRYSKSDGTKIIRVEMMRVVILK